MKWWQMDANKHDRTGWSSKIGLKEMEHLWKEYEELKKVYKCTQMR